MFDKKDSLFRKESLERLSSPERLDQLMQVVNPRDWLALTTLGFFIFLALLWSIFGRIPITVTGQGVLIRPRRVVEFQSPISGQLQSLNVRDGQCIEKDYVLATIDPSDLKQQLQQQRSKRDQLRGQSQDTSLLSGQRTQLEKAAIASSRSSLEQRLRDAQALTPVLKDKGLNAIAQQRQSLQQRLRDAQSLVPVFKERLQRRRELLASGAISEDTILQAEQEYRQELQSISDFEAQLKQLDVSETEAQQKYLENLSTISEIQAQLQELDTKSKRLEQDNLEASQTRENQLQEVERTIAQLEKKVQDSSKIVSTQAGCVLEIIATVGQIVNPGTRLGTIDAKGQASQMVGVTYFAVKDGKQIKPGMPIQITPDTVKRERFGGIVGSITSVSAFPVTKEGAASVVGNPEVAENLIAQAGPKIEAIAKLELDPSTFSGYQWSSSKGPQLKMTPGTTTTARVKVEERSPITFILPILREWSGIN